MNKKIFFIILFFSIQALSCRKEYQLSIAKPSIDLLEPLLETDSNKGTLVNVHIIDFNGFSETITNKERLRQFEKRSFLTPQQYRKVLRVFRRNATGNSISLITLYHDNGQIYRYLECLNGRACGNFREWHENGTLKIAATVLSGNADVDDDSVDSWAFEGNSIAWTQNGKKRGSFPYLKGLLHGTATIWHPSCGSIERTTEYYEGNKEGKEQFFRENGSLLLEASYQKNKRNGISRKFWPTGEIQYEEYFTDDQLEKGFYYDKEPYELVSKVENGEGIRTLYNDSIPIRQEEIHSGIPDGLIKLFSESGTVSQEYSEKGGKKEGKEIIYYPESVFPHISIEWKKGAITGIVETWYPDGTMQSRREMKNNDRDGVSMAWYRNRDLMFVEEYEKNLLKKAIYHKKGEATPYSFIEKGKGTATIFDEEGGLIEKIEYIDGKPIVDL